MGHKMKKLLVGMAFVISLILVVGSQASATFEEPFSVLLGDLHWNSVKNCRGCDNKGWNECAGCKGTGYNRFDVSLPCTSCGGTINPPKRGRGWNSCGVPGCPYRKRT